MPLRRRASGIGRRRYGPQFGPNQRLRQQFAPQPDAKPGLGWGRGGRWGQPWGRGGRFGGNQMKVGSPQQLRQLAVPKVAGQMSPTREKDATPTLPTYGGERPVVAPTTTPTPKIGTQPLPTPKPGIGTQVPGTGAAPAAPPAVDPNIPVVPLPDALKKIPLGPEEIMAIEQLQRELNTALMNVGVGRNDLAAMQKLILERLAVNEGFSRENVNEGASERGIFQSGIRLDDQDKVSLDYLNQRQDYGADWLQQARNLNYQQSQAQDAYTRGYIDVLTEAARRAAQTATEPGKRKPKGKGDGKGKGGTRKRRNRRPGGTWGGVDYVNPGWPGR